MVVGILVAWATAASPVFAQQPVVLTKGDRIQFKAADKGGVPHGGGSGSKGPSIPTNGQTWNHGNTCTVGTWTFNGNNPSTVPSAITVGIDTPSSAPSGTNPVSDATSAVAVWQGSGGALSSFVSTYGSSGLITTAISSLCFATGSANNQWSNSYGGGGYDIHISWVSEFAGQPNVLGQAQAYYFTGTYVIAFVLITVAMSPGCCGALSDHDMQNIVAHEFGHANALGHSNFAGNLAIKTYELMYKYIYGGDTSVTLGSSTNPIVHLSNLDAYALSSVSNLKYNNGPGVYFWFSHPSSLSKPGGSQTDPWAWAPL